MNVDSPMFSLFLVLLFGILKKIAESVSMSVHHFCILFFNNKPFQNPYFVIFLITRGWHIEVPITHMVDI